ncbi:hypothetical protein D1164_14625 [Mariniphaga sediminis]|uniref:Uncharacterized protein n=1 Tax=Mariniphaga sediminis TaxID=1628158 RepID=A0A399CYP0_9BACT|nr:hypothetical protein D1164_14625 [Mariniphaga sediminis]
MTVNGKFQEKMGSYLISSFFGFLLACTIAVIKLAKQSWAQPANFLEFDNLPKLFFGLTVQRLFRNSW